MRRRRRIEPRVVVVQAHAGLVVLALLAGVRALGRCRAVARRAEGVVLRHRPGDAGGVDLLHGAAEMVGEAVGQHAVHARRDHAVSSLWAGVRLRRSSAEMSSSRHSCNSLRKSDSRSNPRVTRKLVTHASDTKSDKTLLRELSDLFIL